MPSCCLLHCQGREPGQALTPRELRLSRAEKHDTGGSKHMFQECITHFHETRERFDAKIKELEKEKADLGRPHGIPPFRP